MDLTTIKQVQENLNVIQSGICRIQLLVREDCEPLRTFSNAYGRLEDHFSKMEQQFSDAARYAADRLKEHQADVKRLMDYSFSEERESYCEERGYGNISVEEAVMHAFHDPNQDHIFCTIARLYAE